MFKANCGLPGESRSQKPWQPSPASGTTRAVAARVCLPQPEVTEPARVPPVVWVPGWARTGAWSWEMKAGARCGDAVGAPGGYRRGCWVHVVHTESLWTDAPQMPVSAPVCAEGQGRGRQGVFHPRVKDFEENHAGQGAYLSPVQKTWVLDLSPPLTAVWPHVKSDHLRTGRGLLLPPSRLSRNSSHEPPAHDRSGSL